MIQIKPCECGGEVYVWKTEGGSNNEMATYGSTCKKCREFHNFLGMSKREGIKTYNREVAK